MKSVILKMLAAMCLIATSQAQAQTAVSEGSVESLVKATQNCIESSDDRAEQLTCVMPFNLTTSSDLQKVYNQFRAALAFKLTPGGRQNLFYQNLSDSLRMSERAWIQFQSNQCEFEGNLNSRKAYIDVTESACAARTNLQRIESLKAQMAELNLLPALGH